MDEKEGWEGRGEEERPVGIKPDLANVGGKTAIRLSIGRKMQYQLANDDVNEPGDRYMDTSPCDPGSVIVRSFERSMCRSLEKIRFFRFVVGYWDVFKEEGTISRLSYL